MKETLDNLSIGNLRLLQAENGYRYSLDPVLLAHYVKVKKGSTVVDLGTGSGILLLLLASLSETGELTGIEIQTGLVDRARRNVLLNNFADHVHILQGDIRNIQGFIPPASIDLVVSNPPYRRQNSGRIAPNSERAAARHELAGGLEDFISAAAWSLKNGGRFAVIYLAERLPELISKMMIAGIEPKRLRMVHSRSGEIAKMVLLEGARGGRPGLQVEKPLYIYKDDELERDYTEEVLRMYAF